MDDIELVFYSPRVMDGPNLFAFRVMESAQEFVKERNFFGGFFIVTVPNENQTPFFFADIGTNFEVGSYRRFFPVGRNQSHLSVGVIFEAMTIFFVQKYVFERKTVSTLTGKASRQRMLIEDKSVTIPLSTFCTIISLFVIVLYGTVICCSFWVNLSDYSFTWDNWKTVFSSDGLGALGSTMETSLIAAPITALLSMIIAYLVVKKRVPGRGLIEFLSMKTKQT